MNGGNDTANGGDGDDAVMGGAGNDYVNGGPGNDRVYGDAGNDRVTGGFGYDSLFGGAGADRFEFGPSYGTSDYNYHTIEDFARGSDKIVLSAIDADGSKVGNQAFKIGSGAIGTVVIEAYSFGTYVRGHTDGNGQEDFQIFLRHNVALTAADFVL